MTKFSSLFGRAKPERDAPAPPAEPAAPGNVGEGTRTARCGICWTAVESPTDADGQFMGNFRVVSDTPAESGPPHVCSCVACDLDVCNRCSRWVHDPDTLGDVAKDAPSGDEGAMLRMMTEKIKKPLCPRCGGELISKTRADLERLQRDFPKVIALSGRERVELARRLLALCQDEAPAFSRAFGPEKFEELRQMLTRLAQS